MRKINGLTKSTFTVPNYIKTWLSDIGGGNMSRGLRILHNEHTEIDIKVGRKPKTAPN